MGVARQMSAHGRGGLLPFILLYTMLYAGFGAVSPFFPTLLQARGLRPDEIGLVLALSTAARLVSGPLAGRVADLFDALRGVFACFAVAAALTAFGFLPAHSFWSALAVSVVYAAMLAPEHAIGEQSVAAKAVYCVCASTRCGYDRPPCRLYETDEHWQRLVPATDTTT